MSKPGSFFEHWRGAGLSAAIGTALLLFPALVAAQPGNTEDAYIVEIEEPRSVVLIARSSDPFSALVGKRKRSRNAQEARSKIELYVLAADDRSFLFEDLTSEVRVQFLCGENDPRLECIIDPYGPAAEIYRLTSNRGPRGDVIYKNDEGETLLRIASYGGATVFWPGDNQGSAASKSFGETRTLALIFEDFDTALRRASSATALISAATGAPIVFNVGEAPPEGQNAAVLADAVVMAAKAIKLVAADPTGARIIASRIEEVQFEAAEAPSLTLDEHVLKIQYAPTGGVESRPSSSAIRRFLEDAL